ncbi:hypothetical protein C4D60_Mb02t22880 [Musa balbisiana]|uniref:Uncharacterized protein n=1 Tax=Musa balbisiana TaxID=52838 RepID=A0A4S8IE18_MUSBA|nr:hypothetical protein C4D60_Mb02t22880 [Musa balbisiana]
MRSYCRSSGTTRGGIASSSGSPTAPNEAAVAPYDALTSPKLAELTSSSIFRHDAAPGSAASKLGDGVSVAKEEATYIQGTKAIGCCDRSNQFISSILQFTSDLSSSGIAIKSVSSAT